MYPKKGRTKCVHWGLADFDWPVGVFGSRNQYIKPISPFYVSEYEASYTWASREEVIGFNNLVPVTSNSDTNKMSRTEAEEGAIADKQVNDDFMNYYEIPHPSNSSGGEIRRPWLKMEEALSDLARLERDSTLASRVKNNAREHKLDDNIERAYKHYKRRISFLERSKPSQHGPLDELLDKMNLFCASVDAIKEAHVLAMK
jgi:hypothetical protein